MNEIILQSTNLPSDQNPAMVYLSRLAPSSQRTQETALSAIAGEFSGGKLTHLQFPWHTLRYQHTQALRARLSSIPDYKPTTINRYLSALRGVLKQAWKLGLMSAEDYARAADVENIKHKPLLSGRALSQDEITSLLQACLIQDSDTGVRDAAIIALMYVTGMRRSEVSKLKMGDVDMGNGQVRIIAGKGNKSRTAYLSPNAKLHLRRWLETRGLKPGMMFLSVDKLGNVQPIELSNQSIYDILERRGKQAGIENFSPHDLRRTAITEMLRRGLDIATVAKIVGHDSLDTTRRYDHRDEDSKMAVMKLFDTPI